MVKISNKVLIAGGLMTAVGASSCGKYEDGPGFSLLSKKSRLTGTWEVDKWYNGSTNMLSNSNVSFEIEFESDGDFETKFMYSYYGDTYSYTQTGEWEFSGDKEEIEMDFDDSSSDEEWEIIRLTNDELHIEYDNMEIEFEKQ